MINYLQIVLWLSIHTRHDQITGRKEPTGISLNIFPGVAKYAMLVSVEFNQKKENYRARAINL